MKTIRTDYHLNQIQNDANILLEKTLSDLKETLRDIYWRVRNEEDQKDKGIDFQCELENNATGETLLIFKIQNKGTEKSIRTLKTKAKIGLISFQLKLRNAIYYRREVNFAVVFTLSDLENKKVYWHSIQLDDSIDNAIKEAQIKKAKSLQIYLNPNNVLNGDKVGRFLKEVYQSYEEQTERFKKYASSIEIFKDIKPNFNFNEKDPLIKQLYNYFKFLYKEISFVPINILKDNYPFIKTEDSYSHYSAFTLSIDNDELFELFESLEIGNGRVCTKSNKFKKGVNDSSKKLAFILQKLSDNLIFNIHSRKKNKTIKIRYSNIEKSSSLGFSFRKLDYLVTLFGLQKKPTKIENKLLLAYINYELGNFVISANQFQEIARIAKKNNQIVRYAIAQFNLSKLYLFIRNNIWDDNDNSELIEELKGIIIVEISSKLKYNGDTKLIDWILNSKFFSSKREEINRTLKSIKDHYYLQLRGGWSSNNHISSLINSYAQIEIFLKENFIVFDKFSEYQEITDGFIEGLIASHAMYEKQSVKLEYFDDWLLSVMVFNGNSNQILKYFSRYELNSLNYKPTADKGFTFFDILKNHLTNYKDIDSAVEKNCEPKNKYFWVRYNEIFCNLILLASIMNLEPNQVRTISKGLINFLENSSFFNRSSIKFIKLFIERKGGYFDKDELYGYLNLFISNGKLHDNELFESLLIQIIKHHKKLVVDSEMLNRLLSMAFESCNFCQHNHPPEFITIVYEGINVEQKKLLKERLDLELSRQFNSFLYYRSVVFNIFDCEDKFFDDYLQYVLPKSKQDSFKSFVTGVEDKSFPDVNRLLDICFKNGIDLTQKRFDGFRKINDYYSWLFNLGGFDYDNFNPKWAREYWTRYYTKEFKKHPIIKQKCLDYLKEQSDFLLEKLLLQLCDDTEK
jgi:hypothetical protein